MSDNTDNVVPLRRKAKPPAPDQVAASTRFIEGLAPGIDPKMAARYGEQIAEELAKRGQRI